MSMKMKLPDMKSMAVNKQPSAQDDTQQKWQTVATTLREIFDKTPITGSFQVLHKIVFTLATSSPQFEYDQLKQYITNQVEGQCKAIMNAIRHHEGVLARVATEYENHAFAILKYSHLFLHLDRHWCPANRQNGVVGLGRDVFGQVILDDKLPIAAAISETFLEAIERERNGEDATPHTLLRTVCMMLLEVGHQSALKRLVVDPFMAQSLQFFEAEASRLLSSLPAPEYVARYRERVALESARCNTVFPNYRYTTMVLNAMAHTYISTRKTEILKQPGSGGMTSLAANWKLKEIGIMFRAMTEIACGSEVVDIVCDNLLTEYGKIAVPPKTPSPTTSTTTNNTDDAAAAASTAKPAAPTSAALTAAQGAQVVMQRCMELIQKSKELVRTSFVLESGAVDRASEIQVTKTVDLLLNADDIISEQLAIHHDAVLRANPSEQELEQCCDNIVAIFSRLKNKDVFEITVKAFLARRMLMAAKAQTEEEHKERILINLLKREVGSAVTSKFEGMFHDKRTSEDISATFHRKLEARGEKLATDIDVVVVTDGLWPQLPVLPLTNVPKELQRSIQLFTSFYIGMHKGRRLDFLFSQGTGDVRLNLLSGKKHELNVPTFCMPVLLMFNGAPSADASFTVKEIADKCGMAEDDVTRAVVSLARSTAHFTGVLVTDSSQRMSSSTAVKFNTLYKSRTNKVKYTAAVAKAGSASNSSGGATGDGIGGKKTPNEVVTEDRKFRIDATVVKIMKSRRVMSHKLLVNEVILMLKSGFAATADAVKRRIENLIDREFLVRNDEGDGYIYKA